MKRPVEQRSSATPISESQGGGKNTIARNFIFGMKLQFITVHGYQPNKNNKNNKFETIEMERSTLYQTVCAGFLFIIVLRLYKESHILDKSILSVL